MRHLLFIFCLSLVPFVTATAQSTVADHSVKARFLREAPAGWKRIREAERQTRGLVHFEAWSLIDGVKNPNWGMDRFFDFRRSGDHVRIVTTYRGLSASKTNPESDNVLVSGPEYSFWVNRSSPAAPYLLRNVGAATAKIEDSTAYKESHVFRGLQAPREIWNLPLDELISDSGFRLKSVKESKGEFGSTVRIDFDADTTKFSQKWRNCWITFAADFDWELLEAEYSPRSDYRVFIENSYEKDDRNRPVLKRYKKTSRYPLEKLEEVYQFTFDRFERGSSPVSDFKLTAFGLTEPNQPLKASENHVAYWFFGMSALAAITAVFVRRGITRKDSVASG